MCNPNRKIKAQQLIDESSYAEFTNQVEMALSDGWEPFGDVRLLQVDSKDKNDRSIKAIRYYQTWIKRQPKKSNIVATYTSTEKEINKYGTINNT